tara:strand:- start:348 stop:566 length:219 start_codon:yes stop_codon:yes gene_type:complete
VVVTLLLPSWSFGYAEEVQIDFGFTLNYVQIIDFLLDTTRFWIISANIDYLSLVKSWDVLTDEKVNLCVETT